ncbi:MAG: hypothetical protein AABW72_04705 [archaeon]
MRLIIKIGGNMEKDMKEVFEDPSKAKPGTHTVYLKSVEELPHILSPKKLELLIKLTKERFEKKTLSELAEELNRKQESVSRDVKLLAKHQMLKKAKERQMVYLKPRFSSIEIKLGT